MESYITPGAKPGLKLLEREHGIYSVKFIKVRMFRDQWILSPVPVEIPNVAKLLLYFLQESVTESLKIYTEGDDHSFKMYTRKGDIELSLVPIQAVTHSSRYAAAIMKALTTVTIMTVTPAVKASCQRKEANWCK